MTEYETCPECKSLEVHTDYKNGCIVCHDCGLQVSGYLISEEQEWRDCDDTQSACRIGIPEDEIFDYGLSTTMNTQSKMYRLQSQTTMSTASQQRFTGHSRLKTFASSLGVSRDVARQAGELFQKYASIHRVKHKDLPLLACLYLVCSDMNLHRTLKEVVQIASTKDRNIRAVDISNMAEKIKPFQGSTSSFGAPDLMPRFCSLLKISKHEQLCCKIARAIETDTVSPSTVAGVAIVFACKLTKIDRSLESISIVTKSSINIIRIAVKDLTPRALEDFPELLSL